MTVNEPPDPETAESERDVEVADAAGTGSEVVRVAVATSETDQDLSVVSPDDALTGAIEAIAAVPPTVSEAGEHPVALCFAFEAQGFKPWCRWRDTAETQVRWGRRHHIT